MNRHFSSRIVTTMLLLCFVLSACDSGGPGATPAAVSDNRPTATPLGIAQAGKSTPTVEMTQATGFDTPARPTDTPAPTIPSSPEPPRAPSSFDKIDTALASGEMDRDMALLYRLYVHYLPDRLPAEFQGDDNVTFPEPTALFDELYERMDNLSPAARAEVEPFFLRPDNPESFWYEIPAQESSSGARGPGVSALVRPSWEYRDSAHIRVQYDSNHPDYAQKAAMLAAEIDRSKMWDKEKKAMLGHEPCTDEGMLLNGGDGKLDIYLVTRPTKVNRVNSDNISDNYDLGKEASGVALRLGPNLGCPMAGFLLVDVTLTDDELFSTTAHELFHAFQYSFDMPEDRDHHLWWIEASATWAEDLVYTTIDSEWSWLHHNWGYDDDRPDRKYFGPLNEYVYGGVVTNPRRNRKVYPQYGSYIWPFYLRQASGGDETIVGRVWEASQREAPLKVMSNMLNWDQNFKEFVLWNWNKTPVEKYSDAGRELEHLYHLPEANLLDLFSNLKYEDQLDLPAVSVRYYKFWITDIGELGTEGFVNQVRFDFGGLQSKPGIQAIIQQGTNTLEPKGYRVEDWSDLTEKAICREVVPVSSIVLVVSNSSISEPVQGLIKAEALNVECPKEANFTSTVESSYAVEHNTDYWQESGSANIKQTLTSSWDIAFAGYDDSDGSTRRQEITNYTFTATNTYEVHMSGNKALTAQPDTSTYSLRSDGIYNTHNPPLPGEDEYEQSTTYGGPDGARMLATRRGSIETYKDRNGKYQYYISFQPPLIALRFVSEHHLVRHCVTESATYDMIMNELGVTGIANGSPDCLSFGPQLGSHKHVNNEPQLYGPPPFTAHSATSQQPGSFDPATGIIEGDLAYTITTCDQARSSEELVDTLNSFAGPYYYSSLGGLDAGSCLVQLRTHYRVQLPPANTQN